MTSITIEIIAAAIKILLATATIWTLLTIYFYHRFKKFLKKLPRYKPP